MKNKLYNLFLMMFQLVFVVILVGTIFDNKSLVLKTTSPIIVILGFIIFGLALILLYKLINKKIDNNISLKKEIIISVIIFGIIFISQIIYAYYMKAYPGWDWNDIFSSAQNYVLNNKTAIDWEYFKLFPNNYGMLYLEILLFKILNIFNIAKSTTALIYATIAVNIILIDIAIILTYLTIRNMLGKKQAIFSLIIMLLNNAFFVYIPVFYTDTVTMLFPIAILYCYSLWDKKQNNNWLLVIISVTTIVGIKIKFTVIIMLIAIVIDMFMKNKFKKIIKPISILAVSMLLLYFLTSFIETRLNIFPYDISKNNKQMPYTHWIMMGMTEKDFQGGKKLTGWYNYDSMQYTLSYNTTKERKEAKPLDAE